MPAPQRAIKAVIHNLSLALLLSTPTAFAAEPFIKIFGIGQGFVVPPNQPVKVQYKVTPELSGNHSFYLDGALLLTRAGNRIDRTSTGAYTLTYPSGLPAGRVAELRICVERTPTPLCDTVNIRSGQVVMPPLTVELGPIGTAGYVPPRTPFNVPYVINKPTTAAQQMYVDDALRLRLTASSPQPGPKTVQYPGGLNTGERRQLRICLEDDTALCGYSEAIGGTPPAGIDLPPPFDIANLPSHYQAVANCDPICGYYSNIYYGDPSVSWIPDRGDGQPDGLRVDLYYSGPTAQHDPNGAPRTVVIYAHSAGISKEALLTTKASILKQLMNVPKSGGAGMVVASADFRHPIKQFNPDRTPVSVKDLSYLVQFLKHYATELNINPDDIFLVGSSLGGGASIHAAVREIANPSDPHPVRRHSSSVRGLFVNDGQTSFAPQWFRASFLEPEVAALYRNDLLPDEKRSIYGHAMSEVNPLRAPLMELTYSSPFIDHKVTLAEYLGLRVDLMHLPNLGLAMEQQYRLHGIEDRIRVRERFAGNFSREVAKFVSENRLGRE